MGRTKRVQRDRAAGMVFDWRSGHGSFSRLLVAVLVSGAFWGALLTWVRISKAESGSISDRQIDLTVVDLDQESNRWLADLIDRETLFHRRWDVSQSPVLDQEIMRAISVAPVRSYTPRLREISRPAPGLEIEFLPGMGLQVLPPAEQTPPQEFATPPVNWWVEVRPVAGTTNWDGFAFSWPNPKDQLSEGELWTLMLCLDWRGEVVLCSPWEAVADPQTAVIVAHCRQPVYPALDSPGPLRWWKLQAEIVNRPLSE